MKNLPIGVQSFANLRKNDFLYVDKTQYIEQLLDGRVYFLSRPRRFGKSLFLSTLAAYFSGQKELFKGLYLEEAEEELAQREKREAWQKYPVLYIDLNIRNYKDEQALLDRLDLILREWEKEYNLPQVSDAPEERFAYIIREIYTQTSGKQVVVLVDEYENLFLKLSIMRNSMLLIEVF